MKSAGFHGRTLEMMPALSVRSGPGGAGIRMVVGTSDDVAAREQAGEGNSLGAVVSAIVEMGKECRRIEVG